MRIQQFMFGNVSLKNEGGLYKKDFDKILDKIMIAIRTTITESFQNIKAQARISKNKDNIKTIYFAVRYEDVDKDKNVYDIINSVLNKECKKIYDEAAKQSQTPPPTPPGSPGGTTPTPSPVPGGSISGILYADHAIIRYTPETLWSDMLEDPMCEVRLGNKSTYKVDNKGSSTVNIEKAPIIWSKDKMKTIRKTVDVLCNYFMDKSEEITEYLTMNIDIKVVDWKKSFNKKDLEQLDWCMNKYINQLNELKYDYVNIFNMVLKLVGDYNTIIGSQRAVLRVPGAISDYGLQKRIEDVRKARQSVKIKDQTEDNKYRMLDLDIDLGDGRTLQLRTDKNAPSMSKFFYKN